MTKRGALWPCDALAALALAALGAALVGCSNAARPASSGSAVATSLSAVATSTYGPANTLQDALTKVREYLEVGPPYVVLHDVGPVVYVETTYGQVVSLRKFNGIPRDENTPPFPSTLPVWLFVAYGKFQDRSMAGSTTPGQTYTTRYFLIAKGEKAFSTGATNEQYDLSSLGTVIQVPVPLPPFPTSVKLNSR